MGKLPAEVRNQPPRSIWKHYPDTLMVLDEKGTILFIDRKLLHRSIEDTLGTRFGDCLGSVARGMLRRSLTGALRTGECVSFEGQDETESWRQIRLQPLPERGNAKRVLAIITDISDLKTLQGRLARRTEVLDQVAAGILLTDTQGIVTYLNPAFAKMLGEKGCEFVGRSVEELVGEGRECGILEPLLETIRSGRPWHGFLKRQDPAGDHEWGTRISLLRKEDGSVSGYLASVRDVTDERRIEHRLNQVQKMEALGNLARGIAHDLRNIFTPIVVNMELLLSESGKEPRARAYLEQALRAAQRGKELVDQITIFGRGGVEEIRRIALGPLIEDSLKILRPVLPPRIEIQTAIGGTDDTVMAHPAQLHQILVNLITNAVQAMKDTGGILDIRLKPIEGNVSPELPPGSYFHLSVGDTGCGMTPEVIERIFEPFFTTREGGSGMGLPIVHGIVKGLRGAITLDSTPGRGSVFHVFLPQAAPGDRPSDRKSRGRTRKREG